MDIKGTRTEKNLWAALNAESAARTKYNIWAMALRAAGQESLARLFEETAQNEFVHAQTWFAALGISTEAAAALAQASAGEHEEWTREYTEFERVAREEGFKQIADQFALTAKVELAHESRFLQAAQALSDSSAHTAEHPTQWRCQNCGHTYIGTTAPKICPLCGKPEGWFEKG